MGITSEKHEHVFDRFFRVGNPESKTMPGLGLGLFISAQIVKRHGGRMWVESRYGCWFHLFLYYPVATSARIRPIAARKSRAACIKKSSSSSNVRNWG